MLRVRNILFWFIIFGLIASVASARRRWTPKAASAAASNPVYASSAQRAPGSITSESVMTLTASVGDVIVMMGMQSTFAANGCVWTDSGSNTYTAVTNITANSDHKDYAAYAKVTTGGTLTITITQTLPSNIRYAGIVISGSTAGTALDQQGTNSNASNTAPTSAAITTTSANSCIVNMYSSNNSANLTPDATFTERQVITATNAYRFWMGTRAVTSTGTYTCTSSTAGAEGWGSIILNIK